VKVKLEKRDLYRLVMEMCEVYRGREKERIAALIIFLAKLIE